MVTWTYPRSGLMHPIDYVIVRHRDRRDVRITRVIRGAQCGTGHKLLRTKLISYSPKACFKALSGKQKLNVRSPRDSQTKMRFEQSVNSRLQEFSYELSPTRQWRKLKEAILAGSTKALSPVHNKRPDWFDSNNKEIAKLVQEKNKKYFGLCSRCGKHQKEKSISKQSSPTHIKTATDQE